MAANINQALQESAVVVAIADLRYFEGNARVHDLDVIRESLRINGQFRAIAVWRNSPLGQEVIAGNGTLEAARAEGWDEIAVTYVEAETRDEAKRMVLVDNRANDLAGYDGPNLSLLLGDLPDFAGTGFRDTDVDRILADNASRYTEPAAAEPAPDIPTITRQGDRIILGDHVLVCGDARLEDSWKDLLREDDDAPALIWTDPPYGVGAVETAGDLTNGVKAGMARHAAMIGDVIDAEALYRLLYAVTAWAFEYSSDQAAIYMCHGDVMRKTVDAALEEAGWRHAQTIVWAKDNMVIGRQDYQWRHEPIWYGWKQGGTHRWFGDRSRTTVIEGATRSALEALAHEDLVDALWTILENIPGTVARFARPQVAREHPTAKPVDMIAHQLHNSSAPREIVLDPFAGSGSTLLAAEQTGRRARCIELEPIYCDVIVARWQELTGTTAMRPTRRRRQRVDADQETA